MRSGTRKVALVLQPLWFLADLYTRCEARHGAAACGLHRQRPSRTRRRAQLGGLQGPLVRDHRRAATIRTRIPGGANGYRRTVNQRLAARRLWHSLPLLIAPLLFCAGRPVEHPQWKADWNVRVDASADLMSHPCGDFAFDPWADAFLDGCGETQTQAEAECRLRSDWVWERSFGP